MRTLRIWVVTAGWIALAAALVIFAGGPASLLRQPGTVSAAESHGLNPADLDLTCKPCQDFYQYATGHSVGHNPIQPAYPSYGRFNDLQNQNELVLKQILEAAARDEHPRARIEFTRKWRFLRQLHGYRPHRSRRP